MLFIFILLILFSGLFVSAVEVLYKISTSREEVEGEVTQQLIDSIHQLGSVEQVTLTMTKFVTYTFTATPSTTHRDIMFDDKFSVIRNKATLI